MTDEQTPAERARANGDMGWFYRIPSRTLRCAVVDVDTAVISADQDGLRLACPAAVMLNADSCAQLRDLIEARFPELRRSPADRSAVPRSLFDEVAEKLMAAEERNANMAIEHREAIQEAVSLRTRLVDLHKERDHLRGLFSAAIQAQNEAEAQGCHFRNQRDQLRRELQSAQGELWRLKAERLRLEPPASSGADEEPSLDF